jgi:hypothetical protein
MSALQYVHKAVIPAALTLLPNMDSPQARVLILTIGLQESRFIHRRQVGGPARGFWQFEMGGTRGVLTHQTSRQLIRSALNAMNYGETADICFAAIEQNDILACVFARLLLWTHPKQIPSDPQGTWDYYLSLWRPGKPHRETWNAFYAEAKELV